MATNELDSILDSLLALQMDLDTCLQQHETKPSPTASEIAVNRAAAPAVVEAAVNPPAPLPSSTAPLMSAIVEENFDDFPPPPPPEELMTQTVPSLCLSQDATAGSICEVASNDSGIQDSPQTTRRIATESAAHRKLSEVEEKATESTATKVQRVTWSVDPPCRVGVAQLQSAVKQPAFIVGASVPSPVLSLEPIRPSERLLEQTQLPQPLPPLQQLPPLQLTEQSQPPPPPPPLLETEQTPPLPTLQKSPPQLQPVEVTATPVVAIATSEPLKSPEPAKETKAETKQERKAREEREKRAKKELERQQKEEAKRSKSIKKKMPEVASPEASIKTNVVSTASPTLAPAPAADPSPSKLSTDGDAALPSLMSVTRPVHHQEQAAEASSEGRSSQQSTLRKQASVASDATAAAGPSPAPVSVDFFKSTMQERIRVMDQLFNKDYLTRMAVRIHCLDRTTKMLALDERSKTGLVCNMMANKALTDRRLNHAIVEKLPDMKMERIIEDHELLGDTLLAWPANSKNLLFFEEREEKFGALSNPDVYLGDSFAKEHGETVQQQLSRVINDLFIGEGTVPAIKEYLNVRAAGTKVWKKRLCLLRSSGIYAMKKGKTDLKCLTCLSGYHLFTTLGGWTSKGKIEAPTPHGFALKALQTHSLQSKQIHFFSATSEVAMKRWCTAIRIAMIGNQYYLSYQFAHKSANTK